MALTLSARRNTVITSSSVGKTEKSSGRLTCIAVSSTSIAALMFIVINRSSTKLGSGITSITTTATTASGTTNNLTFFDLMKPVAGGWSANGMPLGNA